MAIDSAKLLAALRSPDAYPHAAHAIEVIETHISWVILTGKYAYKVKKPVRLPFLDFSTLAQREHYCREELRLNLRLAPEIYLDVVPIGGTPDRPRIGAAPAFEYAVMMRQFDLNATADRLLESGSLPSADLGRLARYVAAFHQSLAPENAAGQEQAIGENLDEFLALQSGSGLSSLEPLAAAMRTAIDRCVQIFATRRNAGCIRECHGDLHLANVARLGERLLPFDCIEFDRTFRTIDVIDEVSFLFMDLASHGRRDLAFEFLNRYLDVTGDYSGLRLLRLYAAHRALVRAKVATIRAAESDAARSADAVARYTHAAKSIQSAAVGPLLITCGLSASGKSTVADRLARALGAIHLRSDIERKRLSGLNPLDRASAAPGEGIYGRTTSDATYRQLLQAAQAALDGGLPVIVDATFINGSRRAEFQRLAAESGTEFRILHCVATQPTVRARIRQRAAAHHDPSDADAAVLDHQLASADRLSESEKSMALTIDTEREIDYDRICALIDRPKKRSPAGRGF